MYLFRYYYTKFIFNLFWIWLVAYSSNLDKEKVCDKRIREYFPEVSCEPYKAL